MSKFRVKIDLSNFFNDERKLTFILIDPCWDSVNCLQKRVEEIFDLDGLWFVTLEGCFLPPQESIHVIKSDDVLKAFTGLDRQKKNSKKSKRFRVSNEIFLEKITSPEGEELGPKLKTRKCNTLDTIFTSSTPNEAKFHNEVLRPIGKSSTVVNEITSTNEQLGFIKYEHQKSQKDVHIFNFCSKEDMGSCDSDDQEQSAGSSPVKRIKKRKYRHKKNKKQKDLAKNVEAASREVSTNNHSSDNSSRILHEFYKNLEKVSTTSTEKKCLLNENKTNNIIFHCPLTEAKFEKPRIFPLKMNSIRVTNHFNVVEGKTDDPVKNAELGSQNNAPSDCEKGDTKRLTKSPIVIQEHIVIPQSIDKIINAKESITDESSIKQAHPGPDDSSVIAIESEGEGGSNNSYDQKRDESNITSVPEVIDLNASDDDQQRKNVQIINSKKSIKRPRDELSINKMVPFTVNLVNLPSIGDIVIFKLPRLDGIISGYIAGKCENVNSRTKNIKLYVIDGFHEIKGISRKYLCLVDDSNLTPERYLQVRLSDMIKPQLFSEN